MLRIWDLSEIIELCNTNPDHIPDLLGELK